MWFCTWAVLVAVAFAKDPIDYAVELHQLLKFMENNKLEGLHIYSKVKVNLIQVLLNAETKMNSQYFMPMSLPHRPRGHGGSIGAPSGGMSAKLPPFELRGGIIGAPAFYDRVVEVPSGGMSVILPQDITQKTDTIDTQISWFIQDDTGEPTSPSQLINDHENQKPVRDSATQSNMHDDVDGSVTRPFAMIQPEISFSPNTNKIRIPLQQKEPAYEPKIVSNATDLTDSQPQMARPPVTGNQFLLQSTTSENEKLASHTVPDMNTLTESEANEHTVAVGSVVSTSRSATLNSITTSNGVGISVTTNSTLGDNIKQNMSVSIRGLCGFPIYNDREKCLRLDYFTQPLLECEVENGAGTFGFFVVLLALIIIFSNSLLPICVWRISEMRTHYDYIKVSLSFSDAIRGFVLLGTVLPNMVWMRNSSELEIVNHIIANTNSPTAIVVGSLITMSTQTSLLHLAFLSIERFIAIQWPLWHMMRRKRTVVATLGIIWIVSFLFSFIPAISPDYFEYKYQPALLIHLMTLKKLSEDEFGLHGQMYVTITLILPYLVMLVFCVITAAISYRKLAARREKFGLNDNRNRRVVEVGASTEKNSGPSHETNTNKNQIKPEISVLRTIFIMIAAFTMTLIPFAIVMFLFTGEVLNCTNYTSPYVITFYAGTTNCFANSIIYSFRDGRFRKAVKTVFFSVFDKVKSRGSATSDTYKTSNV